MKLLFVLSVFSIFLSATCMASETLPTHTRVSESLYLPIAEIFPGQSRYSSRHVSRQVNKIIKANGAFWNIKTLTWTCAHNKQTSVYPITKAFPIIIAPFGYVLVDGHHHLLAALHWGAKTFPAKIIGDLSMLGEDAFWQVAEKNGWVYSYGLDDAFIVPPRDFQCLEDDPIRYFIALVVSKSKNGITQEQPIGTDYPIWLKTGNEPTFSELKMVDALRKNHFSYTNDMGDLLSDETVEEARKILVKAKIPGVNIVETRKHYTTFGIPYDND